MNGESTLAFDMSSIALEPLTKIMLGIEPKHPQYGHRLVPAVDLVGDLGLGLLCFDRSEAMTTGALILHHAALSDVWLPPGLPKTDDGVFFINLEGPVDRLDQKREKPPLRNYWDREGGYALRSDDGRLFKVIPRDYATTPLTEYCGIMGHIVDIQRNPKNPRLSTVVIELKKPLPLFSQEEMLYIKNLAKYSGERISVTMDTSRPDFEPFFFQQVRKDDYVYVVMEPR